jgi:hypothetical protein
MSPALYSYPVAPSAARAMRIRAPPMATAPAARAPLTGADAHIQPRRLNHQSGASPLSTINTSAIG